MTLGPVRVNPMIGDGCGVVKQVPISNGVIAPTESGSGIDRLPVDDALLSVGSQRQGLSSAEAAERLRVHGTNRVERLARTPWWLRLGREFVRFFSLILWVAAALAFVADWYDPANGMSRIGVAVVAVVLISGVFTFWQEYRAERTLDALQKLLPQQVRAMRDGTVVALPTNQLVPGDIILLEQGDNVPADARVIETTGIQVSNAAVTGESLPQSRSADPSSDTDIVTARNILLAGTAVLSGRVKAVVFATGPRTEFGKIARLTLLGDAPVSPLRTQLADLSRLIAGLAVTIGLSFLAIGVMAGMPFWQGFMFCIGIIVAMVPEGLLPTLTLALVLAAQRMAKRNVLIRHLTSVETLGSASVICTDKTGTLTENRMRVQEVMLANAIVPLAAMSPDLARDHADFFQVAGLCHELRQDEQTGRLRGDPMEIALVEMAERAIGTPPHATRLAEHPFDSDRMRQSVSFAMPDGVFLCCKGAPEVVLPLCREIVAGGRIMPLSTEARDAIVHTQKAMAARGLRVLAFASKRRSSTEADASTEQDLVFQGLAGLEDPPRPEVPDAVARCHAAGIKIIMITGDHPDTAVAIAREIGLIRSSTPVVLTGEQMRPLSVRDLALALDHPEVVVARTAPDQKRRIVEALRNQGHIVAVTGDGVNDAPALKAAHIGIAMGLAGTDVAKAAADMVLLDDNFASIVSAVEEGRAVFQNIRKFLTYVLVHNVAELVPFLAFALFPIPLPLTPIQALAVDMGTDSLTALGLGVERPGPDAMRIPPRSPRRRLMDVPLALRSYLFLGVMEAIAAMAAFFFVLVTGGWQYGESLPTDSAVYQSATTACLTAIIVAQIVNVFICRSAIRSVFTMNLFDNPVILAGVALEIGLVMLINYTPWGNMLLNTQPVPAALWLFLLPFVIAMLLAEEGRKWLARWLLQTRPSDRRTSAAFRD